MQPIKLTGDAQREIVTNENISLWGNNNKIEEKKIIAKEDWEFTIEKEK